MYPGIYKNQGLLMEIYLHQTHHTLADFASIQNYLFDYFSPLDSKEIERAEVNSDTSKDIKKITTITDPTLLNHNNNTNCSSSQLLPSQLSSNRNPQLHVFSELFLAGYPLQDLCLQRPFINRYLEHLDQINTWSKEVWGPSVGKESIGLLLGGLNYILGKDGVPVSIENVVFLLRPGAELEALYSKMLLPSYDIFDESKYFTPGQKAQIWEWEGIKIALTICEDIWPSSAYLLDPISEISKRKKDCHERIDLIVNLSASPYHLNKQKMRIERAEEISKLLAAPLVYVNRVGGEDEILFDGQSFIICGDQIITTLPAFKREVFKWNLESGTKNSNLATNLQIEIEKDTQNTWEGLFSPQIMFDSSINKASLLNWSDSDCEEVTSALKFGIKEYARKVTARGKAPKFLVAASGGIDSALVLAIAKLALEAGEYLEAIFMPSRYSATISYELVSELCKRLRVPLHYMPIKFLHQTCKQVYNDTFKRPLEGLADENIQSRLRGTLLFAHSNQTGSLVLNTSNKSEIAVGYSTLYGDSVGAISVLGDVYKTEVYQLSNYINRKFNNLIPEGIITRPPSAELRENQVDQMSLPPYDRLDVIIEGILSYRYDMQDLIKLGLPPEEVERTFRLYHLAEFKRKQFPPILKIKRKSFGFGHRVPITKKSDFYFA